MLLRRLTLAAVLGAGAVLFPAAPVGSQGAAPAVRMIAVEGEGAHFWSRWRGPSGQGLVDGSGYPDRWSATENVLWRTTVPGSGNSSPIVWADRIFLTTGRDRGSRLFVLAYRRSDGVAVVGDRGGPGAAGAGSPQERPCLRHAGHGRRARIRLARRTRPRGARPGRGAYCGIRRSVRSATTTDRPDPRCSIVIASSSTRTRTAARSSPAYDTATGAEVWRTPRDASVGWGTPVAIRVADHDELIVSSQRAVTAYNPDTGRERWRCRGNRFEVIPTPVVAAGLVFCTSGRAGPTLAIRPGGQGDVTDTHVAWSTPRGSPFVPSPIVVGDYLYTINDMSSVVTCFKAATGEVMWQERLGRPLREGFSASPVAVDGKVFFTNDNGTTFVVRAGPDFELLHTNDIGARTLASAALVGGRWYIRTEVELLAIG